MKKLYDIDVELERKRVTVKRAPRVSIEAISAGDAYNLVLADIIAQAQGCDAAKVTCRARTDAKDCLVGTVYPDDCPQMSKAHSGVEREPEEFDKAKAVEAVINPVDLSDKLKAAPAGIPTPASASQPAPTETAKPKPEPGSLEWFIKVGQSIAAHDDRKLRDEIMRQMREGARFPRFVNAEEIDNIQIRPHIGGLQHYRTQIRIPNVQLTHRSRDGAIELAARRAAEAFGKLGDMKPYCTAIKWDHTTGDMIATFELYA